MNNLASNTPSTRSTSLTRRQVLKSATAAAVGVIGSPAIVRSASLNSKLQVACIGVGGMGGATMNNVASHPNVQITALCDVDSKYLAAASGKHPDASKHKDWREMLADHADKFDAVTIGTPDHMHAAPAVTAIRAKKHLYLQKPMATTLHECRVITNEAAKAGVVTQLGNQGRSSIESRHTVELIRSGVIGKIKEVILWENKKLSWWPKNTDISGSGDAVPKSLDWDLWLGVQASRPYFASTYHPQTWRGWYGFGVGEMGDMGCHHFDTSFDALKLTAPLRVRQTTPITTGPLWGKQRQVELVFPGSDITAADTVKLTWHDGDVRPDASRIPLPSDVEKLPESGTCWIGEKGAIFKNYRGGKPVMLADSPSATSVSSSDLGKQNHYHDWVDAVIESRKACGDFSHGGPLTEAVLVGAMADRIGNDWLHWDRASQTFTNSKEATALVSRTYRDGWSVPGLG
ncbi:Gfo/Idh/MocA family protein [Fuerstiella marisgermanici]|uniref:Glucose--fructose oxidoreductase n=1 Tax=Fuerstiella marisgermanici TaxID=1891926 RepID=A0A1P8WP42_9PLAN|nr:Gfo/Idh/MocA family oxidoreductase [Fuerstiella marisgermanici]APZ95821.1 Glucose--fructose oxidoreductase precursor [Fuerstiella marisgermanici]